MRNTKKLVKHTHKKTKNKKNMILLNTFKHVRPFVALMAFFIFIYKLILQGTSALDIEVSLDS